MKQLLLLVTLSLLLFAGCNTAIMMGDRVVGVKSGQFFFTDGTLRTNYTADFETTWVASERALQNMNASILDSEKKISSAEYRARMEDEDIRITIEYVEANLTMVAVRVGLAGNNLASKLIHDRIWDELVKLN